MECGIVQSVLIRTPQKHSSVLCAMFVKEHPPGKQMLLNFVLCTQPCVQEIQPKQREQGGSNAFCCSMVTVHNDNPAPASKIPNC